MNKYKVYFNRKDNIKEVLNERIKDSICHIVWLNKELSDTFNGIYIPASYKSIPMNFGSYTNLKEEDIKSLITYDKSYNNNFAVSFTNQKKTKKKRFELNQGLDFTWGNDEPQDEETPDRERWSGDTESYAIFASEDSKQIATVKAKAPSSFYYMNFEIYTEKDGDDFCIKQIEMKDITIEADTTGTK